jgi:hypothetical protein
MTTQSTSLAEAYVRAVNDGDAAGFRELFADDARVDDNGNLIQGRPAIEEWADREIFAASVSFEVHGETESGGEAVVTTKVDGTFDRTGLPDPLIMTHRVAVESGKIRSLTCRLA